MDTLSYEIVPCIELGGCYFWQIIKAVEVIKVSKGVYRDRDEAKKAAEEFLYRVLA